MARKSTACLDTTIPNALFQEPEDRRRATQRFFAEAVSGYEVLISEVTIAELRATPESELRERLLASVEHFGVLAVTPLAERLAREYLRYVRMPQADALHIAVASTEGVNYLVTWNMRHLAREKTRRIVENVNFLFRLPSLFIATPNDLID